MLERIYGGVRHLGRKGEFKEHKRSNQRVKKRISTKHRRCSKTRTQERNV